MSTAPVMQPSNTRLALRTPVGGLAIPAGQLKQLGVVDVAQFERSRVVADDERTVR